MNMPSLVRGSLCITNRDRFLSSEEEPLVACYVLILIFWDLLLYHVSLHGLGERNLLGLHCNHSFTMYL